MVGRGGTLKSENARIRFAIMIIEVMTIGSNTIFLNNPYFVKLGLIGLFINSLLSSVIPIPTELTISGLLLEGQSRIAIFIILVSGSILGGFIAYYIGYGGIGFLKRLRKKPSKKSEDKSTSLLKKVRLDYIVHLVMDTDNWRLYTHSSWCYKV